MRPIPNSPITINTLYIILKGRVADILIPTSMSCTITLIITSLILRKNTINIPRNTRYSQQYNMVTWVMGGRSAGLGPIYTSPRTTNSFYNVARGKVSSRFRLISSYVSIKSYITPQVTIITTYIYPYITIIKNDTTLL